MLPEKIAFVDIETTGGRSLYDRILEIGVLRVENGEIVDTYQTLLNPNKYIPPEITLLTGITGKDVEDAPSFYEVSERLQEILSDAVFVAHNVRFDYGFIKAEFGRMNIPFSPKHFCTVRLSRSLFPQHRHHNLDSIIERFGFECESRHRAYDDAKVLWDFYSVLQKTIDPETLAAAVNKALKKPSVPVKLQREIIDNLPETPGVYIFYGSQEPPATEQLTLLDSSSHADSSFLRRQESAEQEQIPAYAGMTTKQLPIYIGKSINIKERVMSHFSADIHNGSEMRISQQIEHIETIQTAGELGALFLESHLIKTMLPIYNKMLRLKRELVMLKKKINKDGYFTVEISLCTPEDLRIPHSFPLSLREDQGESWASRNSDLNKLSPQPSLTERGSESFFDSFLGLFKSRKQAKTFLADLAKEHSLCEKLLGVESTLASCFGYRLGRCNGACAGEELNLKYNMRFAEAFANRKIKSWSFPGPISIEERNEYTGAIDNFIVDNWCYVGKVTSIDGATNEQLESDITFDLDIYKILVRFMLNPRNVKKIKQLSDSSTLETSKETKYAAYL